METLERFKEIMKAIRDGEDGTKFRNELKEIVETLSPEELMAYEEELVELDLQPEHMGHLCAAHMAAVEGSAERTMNSLPEGHVIRTMMEEHRVILGYLDKLDSLISEARQGKMSEERIKELIHVAQHLVDAEPHHKREEDVLFPEVEKRGVYGPPHVMRMEHVELRKKKHSVLDSAKQLLEGDSEEIRMRIKQDGGYLVFALREHIFKEDNILYPTALQVIREEEVWDNMREECDKIGYCCFTPSTKS